MQNLQSIEETLQKLKAEISEIKRGSRGGHQRPHKFVMLLAVIEMTERGLLAENKIYLQNPLIAIFESLFSLARRKDDLCQPGPPFFHLRSSGFWFHKVKPSKEDAYARLKSPGGGMQIILDHVEYAYLRDDWFQALSQPKVRKELRSYIADLLNQDNIPNATTYGEAIQPDRAVKETKEVKPKDMPKRLETAFHETFYLSRPELSQMLKVIHNQADALDDATLREVLREHTHLGTNQIRAMPRYGFGTGLLDEKYQLTTFGKLMLQHDPLLESAGTQWLMHYFMSSPHGPGPAFWHNLVTSRFRIGDQFSRSDLVFQAKSFISDTLGKQLKDDTIEAAITAFLGTYVKPDGLSRLEILVNDGSDTYTVLDPEAPSMRVVACALMDLWQAKYTNLATINLNDLYGANGLSSIFMVGRGKLNSLLEEMQQEGVVEMFRIAPPYQVRLLHSDVALMLGKLYGTDIAS